MNTRKVILLCLVGLLLSTAAHAKIVFSSERNGLRGVYVMDDDGSNQTLLTVEEKWGPYPWSWSPDGTQILFKHRSAFFLMNPDSTNIRQLTENDDSYIGQASFSPDGNFIVYDGSVKIANNNEKYVIKMLNIKTGNIEVISDLSVIQCDWSPDGKHIIFAEPLSPGRNGTIWIMGADGHNPRRLIPDPVRKRIISSFTDPDRVGHRTVSKLCSRKIIENGSSCQMSVICLSSKRFGI